jgi:hypothetical protein
MLWRAASQPSGRRSVGSLWLYSRRNQLRRIRRHGCRHRASGIIPRMPTRALDRPRFGEKKMTGGGANAPGGGDAGGWSMDERWLLDFARRFAAEQGYQVDDSFAAAFLAAVRSRNLEEDNLHTESEAVENTKRLITRAITLGHPTKIFDSSTFRDSLRDFCPMWPFCR